MRKLEETRVENNNTGCVPVIIVLIIFWMFVGFIANHIWNFL